MEQFPHALRSALRFSRRAAASGLLAAALLCQSAISPAGPALAQDAPCEIGGGFATLRAMMGAQDTGFCIEHPWIDANGHTNQRTNVGLFLWRPADNWTGFTDGFRTWINGPTGLAVRPNYERFPFESDAVPAGTGAGTTTGFVAPSPRPLVNVWFDWYSATVNGVSPHGHHAARVKPGDEVTVRLNTVTSHDALFLVDIEIYDHQYGMDEQKRKLWQTYSEHHFAANQSTWLDKKITVPTLPPGRYRVHLGVFTPDWQHMMAWNDYIGFLEIG